MQSHKCVIKPTSKNSFSVKLPARSACFFTTDYQDRIPSAINNIFIKDGKLVWDKSSDKEHCYYRVYKNGKQIASTVATYVKVNDTDVSLYSVKSVDKWGNVRR